MNEVKYEGFESYLTGTQLKYECEDMYMLSTGAMTYTCNADGSWGITDMPKKRREPRQGDITDML